MGHIGPILRYKMSPRALASPTNRARPNLTRCTANKCIDHDGVALVPGVGGGSGAGTAGEGAGAVTGECTGFIGAGAAATGISGAGAGRGVTDGTGATTGLEGGCAPGADTGCCTGEIDGAAVG